MATSWSSPAIPYPITPLDRGSGFVPSIGDPGSPTATRVLQFKTQHLLDYSYRKSPLISKGGASIETMAKQTYNKSSLLGRNGASAKMMIKQTYQKASLGSGTNTIMGGSQSVGRAPPYGKIAQYLYQPGKVGSLSRFTRISQSAAYGPH